jgi:hypothetical protein
MASILLLAGWCELHPCLQARIPFGVVVPSGYRHELIGAGNVGFFSGEDQGYAFDAFRYID